MRRTPCNKKAHVGRVDQEDSNSHRRRCQSPNQPFSRDRTSTRAHVAAAALDETLSFFVRATGEDEASMRQRLTQQEVGRVATCARFPENTHGGEATLRQQKKEAWGSSTGRHVFFGLMKKLEELREDMGAATLPIVSRSSPCETRRRI